MSGILGSVGGVVLAVIVGVTLIVGIWLLTTYNRFVRLRAHVRDSWAGVDVELKRRHDLIPNLVETVKGYASHERSVFEAVAEARADAQRIEQPSANAAPADAARAEQRVTDTLDRLVAVAEAYPDLKADRNFLALQHQLAETENRIAAARRFYNGNVRTNNTLCEMFPSRLVAGWFSFTPHPYFELTDPAARAAPSVSLHDAPTDDRAGPGPAGSAG